MGIDSGIGSDMFVCIAGRNWSAWSFSVYYLPAGLFVLRSAPAFPSLTFQGERSISLFIGMNLYDRSVKRLSENHM